MNTGATPNWEQEADATRRRVDSRLEALLHGGPERLLEAMRYVVLGGGKRLRPMLVLWTHDMLVERAVEPVLDVACAFELVHSYSLVHDDLPCMDDDTLRRGRPTCHVQFDEATAVLTGDALLNLAYEVIATAAWSEPARAVACLRTLAAAASHRELVGGQMLDLLGSGRTPTPESVEAIHLAKTAAIIRAACACGGIAAGADADTVAALDGFGRHLGLAFQITDDVLDVVGTAPELGKTAGKDADAGKSTYPALVGVEASRAAAARHIEAAQRSLERWPRSARLQEVAAWVGTRLH